MIGMKYSMLMVISGGILGGLVGGILVQDSQKRKISDNFQLSFNKALSSDWKKIGLKSKISILCDYSIIVPFSIAIGSGTMIVITKPF